jgi:hypothetical protein
MLTIFITNPYNQSETWEMPTDEVKWTEELNMIKSGDFSVPFPKMKQLADKLNVSVAHIIRGGPRHVVISDGRFTDDPLLFKGWLRGYSFFSSASEPTTINITFADLGVMLSKRTGQKFAFYNNVPSAWIFQQELYIAQERESGSMGLTLGQLPDTTHRQRTVERTNLLDLLVGMSSEKTRNGFDFDVNKRGEIIIYSQRGEVQKNLVLDSRNANQPQVNGQLMSGLSNEVHVQGSELRDSEGNVTQEALQITEDNQESQELWGLHEEYVSATDIATEPFLRERGKQVLSERALPVLTETITCNHMGKDPDWRSYNIGDWLPVDLPDYEINELLRVRKRTINYKEGVYQVSGLRLTREDVPNV